MKNLRTFRLQILEDGTIWGKVSQRAFRPELIIGILSKSIKQNELFYHEEMGAYAMRRSLNMSFDIIEIEMDQIRRKHC